MATMVIAMLPLRALVCLYLLVTLASSARAITCYECDSVNNPGCGEQFASDDIATTDCEVVADLRSPGTEPTCLTKYHEGGPGNHVSCVVPATMVTPRRLG
ncbi:uncharacterized protein LOC110187266 [Drosophila serrata]|uniref:uncharacterized protein LOC110187266 n=1 Tax=Drosophila serrata TaxID=7274 RepID=UPI000A1D25C9|nr:uncharacterized protein LOC110187266 [Drosophila serrata]